MTRAQLEHVLRASGTIADTEDLIVIGSQAILGQFPDAPREFLVSNEADVFPRDDLASSDLIDLQSVRARRSSERSATTLMEWIKPPRYCRKVGASVWSWFVERTRVLCEAGAWKSTTWRLQNT